MADFSPCWEGDVPTSCIYRYERNDEVFEVLVEGNGLIQIKENDWLSKYSLAIHGDYDVLSIRENGGADPRFYSVSNNPKLYSEYPLLEPILNEDFIYTGRLLIHMPTYVQFLIWENTYNYEIPDIQKDIDLVLIGKDKGEIGDIILAKDIGEDLYRSVSPIWQALQSNPMIFANVANVFKKFAKEDLSHISERDESIETIKSHSYAFTAWLFDDLFSESRPTEINPGGKPYLLFPINPEIVSRNFLRMHHRLWARGSAHGEGWINAKLDTLIKIWENSSSLLGKLNYEADQFLLLTNSRNNTQWTRRDYVRALVDRIRILQNRSYGRVDCLFESITSILDSDEFSSIHFLGLKVNKDQTVKSLIEKDIFGFLNKSFSIPIRNPTSIIPPPY